MSQMRSLVLIFLLPVFFSLIGCQTPNVRPFAEATAELRLAVASSGQATVSAQASAPFFEDGRLLSPDHENHPSRELAEAWALRIRAMDALVAYADSLAAIVEASRMGEQNARALGASVESLASYIPQAQGVVREGMALGVIIAKAAIEVKAAHDLSEAVEKAHPAVKKIAEIISEDIDDLKKLYNSAWRRMLKDLNDEFGARVQYRNSLLKRRDEMRTYALENMNDTTVKQVKVVEDLFALADRDYVEYTRRLSGLLRDRILANQLLDKAQEGLEFWVRSHEGLRVAIKEKQRPNVRLLLITALEIKGALEEMKKKD